MYAKEGTLQVPISPLFDANKRKVNAASFTHVTCHVCECHA